MEFVELIRALPSVFPSKEPEEDEEDEEEEEEEVRDVEIVIDGGPGTPVNEIEGDVELNTGPFALVSESLVNPVHEETTESEPAPLYASVYPEEDSTDGRGIPINNNDNNGDNNGGEAAGAGIRYSNSPTINPLYTNDTANNTVLSSGFDLKENHYSHSAASLDLPRIAAEDELQDEDAENDDSESVGSQYSEGNLFNFRLEGTTHK